MSCLARIGGGGLQPGIYCALPARHGGDHAPAAPVPRGKHKNPLVSTETCWVCDRCSQRLYYTNGYCEKCAFRRSIGAREDPQQTHCTSCGVIYLEQLSQ